MADSTLNLLINQEQYDFINSERGVLDMFNATGNLSNLNPVYLKGCNAISMLIYGCAPHNTWCPSCIAGMLRPLIYQINKYEERQRSA